MKEQGWHGPPGNQDLPNQPFQNVASSCDCNQQCIGESDCEYWVYEEANGNCWLKKNFEKIIETPGQISGLKGFEFQKMILIMLSFIYTGVSISSYHIFPSSYLLGWTTESRRGRR